MRNVCILIAVGVGVGGGPGLASADMSIVPAIIADAHAESAPAPVAATPPDGFSKSIVPATAATAAQSKPVVALGASGGAGKAAGEKLAPATSGGAEQAAGEKVVQPAAAPPKKTAEGPPALKLLSPNTPLTARERASAAIAARWRVRTASPAEGAAGAVNFMFGATLPSVVCSPLFVCTISLQPGEIVNDIKTGDSVRWLISPSVVGAGDTKTTVVAVKPTDAGLRTDLVIATTKRLYHIELVSHQSDWMANVTFTYPEDQQAEWKAYQQQVQKTAADNTLATGQNIAALDFGFTLSGDNPPWRPLRVYSDGIKTFIQFPRSMLSGEAPSLVSLADDGGLFSGQTPQIVNYRVEGVTYVVDKVLRRAALITGVGGAQQRVEIAHAGSGR